jgi:hypothetical protein
MKTLDKPIFALGKGLPGRLPSGGPVIRLSRAADIEQALEHSAKGWIASDDVSAVELVGKAAHKLGGLQRKVPSLGKLFLLETSNLDVLSTAANVFPRVYWSDSPKHRLPLVQIVKVVMAPDARDRIISGRVDLQTKMLKLVRGDFSSLLVPLSIFKPAGDGVVPDPTDFEVIDFGHAIRLGQYESAADAIFYEVDPEYRKRLREKRRAEEQTFGASLRRLRLQRGLRQSDFGFPQRTIARIESGVVAKPHPATVRQIADCLGVQPDEIETF